MQTAIEWQSFLHVLMTALQGLFLLCTIVNLLAATRSIPFVQSITVSLSRAVVPLLELALVTASLTMLLALLLNAFADTDQRLAHAPYLLSYMFVGLVTGTFRLQSCSDAPASECMDQHCCA